MSKITIADITAALVENDEVLNDLRSTIDSLIAIEKENETLKYENRRLRLELARNQKAD